MAAAQIERARLVGVLEEVADRLLDVRDAARLAHTLEDGAVMCSHGDVIPEVIDALERRGMEVSGFRESRKGSVWVLERRGDEFIGGHAWPPPRFD